MIDFQVSVIIPVYNAAAYIRQAVESAEALKEVGEVLLIEDKSPDDALTICHELTRSYNKVKVYQHPNGENRGAGASRNLGIEKATCEYVAFLDADDHYLENRFKVTRTTFESNPSAEGVYEAIGYYKNGVNYLEHFKRFGLSKAIAPERLFHYLLRGTFGHFHTNGITIRKQLFSNAGSFNTALRLHQDSELWLRLAFHGKLYAGELQHPVAMARWHELNRITHANAVSKLQFWSVVRDYYSEKSINFVERLLISYKYFQVKFKVLFS